MWLLWLAIGCSWVVIAFLVWMQFQIMRQSGAILARMEAMQAQQDQPHDYPSSYPAHAVAASNGTGDAGYRQDAGAAEETPYYGLNIGDTAPTFDLPDLSGKRHMLSEWRGKPLLIVFFSPRCGFCTEIAPDLAAMSPEGAGGRPIPIIVTNGTAKENEEWIKQYGIKCIVLLQKGMDVANKYNATGTPMGYLVDGEGKIASLMAVGGSSIVDLIPVAVGMVKKPLSESKIARDGLRKGTPAPDFDLPNLTQSGGRVSLKDYRGRRVLLVFSDPQCGPCLEMAPELQAIHRGRTKGSTGNTGTDLNMVMITRGDRAANVAKVKEHGITFPVALQKQWEISKKYAMFATPVAYLVDGDGIIAEEIAVGVDDILALAASSAQETGIAEVRKEVLV